MTGPSDAVLMTLAGIAYGDPARIPDYLAKATPTAGWRVVWSPVVDAAPTNFMFVAGDGTGQCVVAIRGTYPNPFSEAYWADGSQDSPFGTMVDWPGAPGAKIAAGTHAGLSNLMALRDAAGRTLVEFVATMAMPTLVTVTGHSLGGTLAPVVALNVASARSGLAVGSTSYAGLTPGNAAFAALFGPGTSLRGPVRRVYNTLDSVAYGWDRVWATHDFYQPAPRGGDLVAALLLATEARLRLGGYDYTAVGMPVPLTGQVQPPTVPCNLIAYLIENLHQHMPDTYLGLLGAPPLPFSILWGTVTVGRDHPAAARPIAPAGPVFHLP